MQGSGSASVVFMQMYGEYLLNGGNPEHYMDLTYDEIQLMLTVSSASKTRERMELLKGIGKMMGLKEN